jgi:hypothetical protein
MAFPASKPAPRRTTLPPLLLFVLTVGLSSGNAIQSASSWADLGRLSACLSRHASTVRFSPADTPGIGAPIEVARIQSLAFE